MGSLPESLPEIISEFIKTTIFIVANEKCYDFDLFECGMIYLTQIL